MTNADRAIATILEADPSRPLVIGQLGQSLDGRIALPSGESKYINGPAALDHLHRLRAVVDAVIVGIGTVVADDPLLTVRRVAGQNPARIIIDPNGRLELPRNCMASDGARVVILRKADCRAPVPKTAEILSPDATTEGGGFTCRSIIDILETNGFRRLLVEGGASTVSRFFEEKQLDRLHLLVGPVFLGSGTSGINISPPTCLASALRVKPTVYPLSEGDVLFDCALERS